MWAQLSFVLSQITLLTDGRTDSKKENLLKNKTNIKSILMFCVLVKIVQ